MNNKKIISCILLAIVVSFYYLHYSNQKNKEFVESLGLEQEITAKLVSVHPDQGTFALAIGDLYLFKFEKESQEIAAMLNIKKCYEGSFWAKSKQKRPWCQLKIPDIYQIGQDVKIKYFNYRGKKYLSEISLKEETVYCPFSATRTVVQDICLLKDTNH